MISSLGESGFSVFQAGHCDWQRPHSVQVVKSRMPFQEKSSIVPTPSTESSSRSSMSSRVTGLAGGRQRLHRAQRGAAVGLALEVDVEPGGEAVPGDAHGDVAGDHHQPDHRQRDLEGRDGVDEVLERAGGVGVERVADPRRDRVVRSARPPRRASTPRRGRTGSPRPRAAPAPRRSRPARRSSRRTGSCGPRSAGGASGGRRSGRRCRPC